MFVVQGEKNKKEKKPLKRNERDLHLNKISRLGSETNQIIPTILNIYMVLFFNNIVSRLCFRIPSSVARVLHRLVFTAFLFNDL